MFRPFFSGLLIASSLSLIACSASGASGGSSSANVTPALATPGSASPATASPAPGSTVTFPSSSISLNQIGATQTLTPAQTNYSGSFSESDSCAGIATIAADTAGKNFLITALAPGQCVVTITGANGAEGTQNINVTTTTGTFS